MQRNGTRVGLGGLVALTLGCSSKQADTESSARPPLEPLRVGLMVHLENHPVSEHDEYKAAILEYADIFDAFGATPTWEAKEPIFSCAEHEDYYFKGLEARGHGVGVHADVGFAPNNANYDYNLMVTELKEFRTLLQRQDVDVQSVSGICSHLDWVAAAVEAEYSYVSGLVAYCTQSLSTADIPAEYQGCASPADCHEPWPTAFAERLHPWRVDADNWTLSDPDGPLVVMPEATIGLPDCDYYLADDPDTWTSDHLLTSADIDGYFLMLDQALEDRDPDRINTFFQLWSYGRALDHDTLRDWLGRLDGYVQRGEVQWNTLPEMFAAFEAWEGEDA